MKLITLLVISFLSFLAACTPPEFKETRIPLLHLGGNEYLYVGMDKTVRGGSPIDYGYSLRSTKDGRVLLTFEFPPKEVRLEDFNGDGVKDLVHIVTDRKVEGINPLDFGYSLRVALGIGNGTFKEATVVKTFKAIN